MKVSLQAVLLLIFCLSIFSTRDIIVSDATQPNKGDQQIEEVLYLPSGKGLNFLSFGYKNSLSNLLWFNTVNYFGKHYRGDRSYEWLGHMCGLVTDLNPQAHHVYEFCSLMLAWEAGAHEEGIALLGKGIERNPDYWRNYYLRGMLKMLFSDQSESIILDFSTAARLPDAPYFLASIAGKKMAELQNTETASEFLINIIENSDSDIVREALIKRLEEIHDKFNSGEGI